MRALSLAFLIVCLSVAVSAQTTILSQNFESINASGDTLAGWAFSNAKTWKLAGYGHNSDKYAGWNESTNADHWIRSPKVTNPGVVTFWLAGYNDATSLSVKVQVSTDGTTWTDKGTFPSKGAGGDFGLNFFQKSVSLQLTGNYYIRWTTANYVSGGFYIDDIVVTGLPLTQDFESINASGDTLAGWAFNNTKTWKLAGYGHNSDKYAGWNESTNADHWIRSPKVTNPGVVTFWLAGFNDATNLSVKVQVSTDGTTWTDKGSFPSKGAGGDFGLNFFQKSVSLQLTGSYYLRWTTASYISGGFYIDDIVVTGLVTAVENEHPMTATSFRLHQNYPNPFNPTTTIDFYLPSRGFTTLKIFDLLGRDVATLVHGELPEGAYTFRWNASTLPSGTYFYILSSDGMKETKRMMLLK